MANISGFDKLREEAKDDQSANSYYVGGASGHGGGSGLSVVGNGDEASDPVGNIMSAARNFAEQEQQQDDQTTGQSRTITFYRNGFQVDDGPLRPMTDPANKPFLEDIAKGIAPRELEASSDGRPVSINIIDKRGEDFEEPPAPKYVAFGGEGRAMGSSGSSTENGVVGCSQWGGDRPTLRESEPATTMQIRLHSGKRLRVRLNLDHTVQDLMNFINSEGAGEQPYSLLTGYPPAPLADAQSTIKDAGLSGASVTQKLVEL